MKVRFRIFRSYRGGFFSFLTLPVYFWRFSFDFGTQLHHLFCHPSAVVKHRDDAQDEVCTDAHAHAHTGLVFWIFVCALKASLQWMSYST